MSLACKYYLCVTSYLKSEIEIEIVLGGRGVVFVRHESKLNGNATFIFMSFSFEL
jgi:exosome complex RNA-binding protein Rrp4